MSATWTIYSVESSLVKIPTLHEALIDMRLSDKYAKFLQNLTT